METIKDAPVKPYTKKELAALYGVSLKTISTWLKPHQAAVGKKVSHFYTKLQIATIFKILGAPDENTRK